MFEFLIIVKGKSEILTYEQLHLSFFFVCVCGGGVYSWYDSGNFVSQRDRISVALYATE